MVDELVAAADGVAHPAEAVGCWVRVENAAAARRLRASADLLYAQMRGDDAEDREQWCIDNWDQVSAQIGAAQNVSLGVASHQLSLAIALRERLPRVAEVFATGAVSLRMVNILVYRTALIKDRQALARSTPNWPPSRPAVDRWAKPPSREPWTRWWIATTRVRCAAARTRSATETSPSHPHPTATAPMT
jgi:hypothetical protein